MIVVRESLVAPILRALGDPEDRPLARSIVGTDDAAAIAARVDGQCRAALAVIGHNDWSARNMRFGRGGEVSAVYDWDSLAVEPEAVIVGKAAVTFPVTWYVEVRKYPPPEVAAGFVRDYEAARGRRFGPAERAAIRRRNAAGLSTRPPRRSQPFHQRSE